MKHLIVFLIVSLLGCTSEPNRGLPHANRLVIVTSEKIDGSRIFIIKDTVTEREFLYQYNTSFIEILPKEKDHE